MIMAYFSMVSVLSLLLIIGGANAVKLYPISQEKFNNETGFVQTPGLLEGLTDARPLVIYYAYHQLQTEGSVGYYGFSVTTDVYGLSLRNDEYSSAVVQISSGEGDGWNVIQIGWEVYPGLYGGDSRTHLGAIWTTDGFLNTNCINTGCPVGFQPEAGATLVLGDIIEPVSQPNGTKQTITVKVLKDGALGDWLVHIGANQREPTLIGRYPRSLFTGGLANGATQIRFAGVAAAGTTHLAPMGSGYLPTDHAMAASIADIHLFDENGQASLLSHDLPVHGSQSDAYSVTPVINGQFFYGGPFNSTA